MRIGTGSYRVSSWRTRFRARSFQRRRGTSRQRRHLFGRSRSFTRTSPSARASSHISPRMPPRYLQRTTSDRELVTSAKCTFKTMISDRAVHIKGSLFQVTAASIIFQAWRIIADGNVEEQRLKVFISFRNRWDGFGPTLKMPIVVGLLILLRPL